VKPLRILTASEQVAEHLRRELRAGHWADGVPGLLRLAAELGVGKRTIEAAMRMLEQEELLLVRGHGRRRVPATAGSPRQPQLRIALLDYDPPAKTEHWSHEMLYRLNDAGHDAFFAGKCLTQLKMDVAQVERLVARTKADAWIVAAGSRDVLEWFAASGLPVMALFGRRRGLPLAGVGPDQPQAMTGLTRQLVRLGHRRIVLIVRRSRLLPMPGASEQAFLAVLEEAGLATGSYNLPDWEDSLPGLHRKLSVLFAHTPPTALVVDESPLFWAVQQFVARRRLLVPEDVSLACTDPSPDFAWQQPPVTHVRWDYRPVIRRVMRWADNVAHGKDDRRQTLTKAELVEGGTIGPALAISARRTKSI
jgi:DNA-binding LacI/PurR family transcriptional regulator